MGLNSISARRKRESGVISIIIIYWNMKKNSISLRETLPRTGAVTVGGEEGGLGSQDVSSGAKSHRQEGREGTFWWVVCPCGDMSMWLHKGSHCVESSPCWNSFPLKSDSWRGRKPFLLSFYQTKWDLWRGHDILHACSVCMWYRNPLYSLGSPRQLQNLKRIWGSGGWKIVWSIDTISEDVRKWDQELCNDTGVKWLFCTINMPLKDFWPSMT